MNTKVSGLYKQNDECKKISPARDDIERNSFGEAFEAPKEKLQHVAIMGEMCRLKMQYGPQLIEIILLSKMPITDPETISHRQYDRGHTLVQLEEIRIDTKQS